MDSLADIKNSLHQVETDAIVCLACTRGDREEVLLLCDGLACDRAFHTDCIGLKTVPAGDWYCPRCAGQQIETDVEMAPEPLDDSPSGYVHVYERISSKKQDGPGREGLSTQNAAILQFCLKNNIKIQKTITDTGTGTNVAKLSGFRDLQKIPPNTCVLVYSVSRFGRNAHQMEAALKTLHQRGCYIYSVTEQVSSRDASFTELAKQAQMESERLSQVIKASYARRREQGHYLGRIVPWGLEIYKDSNGRRRLRPSRLKRAGFDILSSGANVPVPTRVTALRKVYPTESWDMVRAQRLQRQLQAVQRFIDVDGVPFRTPGAPQYVRQYR